jgi:hypothetical protein
MIRFNEEEHVQLHYGVGATCIPTGVRRHLWQRCNSHCRSLNAPQICRVAAAIAGKSDLMLLWVTRASRWRACEGAGAPVKALA